jgi:hypothetical protein
MESAMTSEESLEGPAFPSDTAIARLVGEVYEGAAPAERGRLLEQLLQPLGVLSLFAVAGGLFAKLRLRAGWEAMHIRLDDLAQVRASDVAALVEHVQQVSIDVVDGLSSTLASAPLVAGSAAALLAAILVQRARARAAARRRTP